ncbi:MAG TPA: hypothetical protein VGG19_09765 [Tepidisphaeraceae bacterium]|jgi:hypothetical protein
MFSRIVLLIAILTSATFGQTWVGPDGGDWSDQANWSGGFPYAPGGTINLTASSPETIIFDYDYLSESDESTSTLNEGQNISLDLEKSARLLVCAVANLQGTVDQAGGTFSLYNTSYSEHIDTVNGYTYKTAYFAKAVCNLSGTYNLAGGGFMLPRITSFCRQTWR